MKARWTVHAPAISVGLASLLIASGGDAARVALRYDRVALLHGEFWRVISGHLAHLSTTHLFMNIAALALIQAIVGTTLGARRWIIVFGVSALAISAGLWVFHPKILWYVGLSGVLHGLLIAGTLLAWRAGQKIEAIVLVAILLKLIWEQSFGPLPGSAEAAGGPVLVDAHWYGAIAGMVCVVSWWIRDMKGQGH